MKRILALTALLIMSACSTNGSGNAQLQQAETDVGIMASAIAADAPAIAAVSGMSAADQAKVAAAASAIQGAATQMASATSAASAQPAVQVIETNLNILVATAAAYPGMPKNVATDLQAATILLPVVETAGGMIESAVSAPKTAVASAPTPAPAMDADEARLVLIAAAKK